MTSNLRPAVLNVNPEVAKEFFFEGMLNGYAANIEPEKDKPKPGWDMVEYKRGNFHLVDMWLVNPHSYNSGGTTTIHWDGLPIWIMHYGGWYHDAAIDTLRSALKLAYEERQFLGGRGPAFFESNSCRYTNHVTANSFMNFAGTETIVTTTTRRALGTHWYKGEWFLTK